MAPGAPVWPSPAGHGSRVVGHEARVAGLGRIICDQAVQPGYPGLRKLSTLDSRPATDDSNATLHIAPPRPLSILRASSHTSLGPTMLTTEAERLHKLRHDLSNPLSALLAETQLLLLNESKLDAETLSSLREIEALAVRMRNILREQ